MHDALALSFGKPAFHDGQHAALAAHDSPLAAWRAAYARWGATAPAQVGDDFAVAVDVPGGQFLAVDRFAFHSLCYRIADGRLSVAPRADQLGATELDPQALFDYFYFHVIPSPRTVFKGVFRLPPGHYALFKDGQLTVAPYWQPQFEEACSPSFEQLREEFLSCVRNAVSHRLGVGKTGCYLSGGTDSSTVAGMATQLLGQPADTYSIGFDVAGYDEMSYARLAAQHFGTRHHEYYVTPDDLIAGIPAVAAHYDQPFGNSSAVPAYYCARMAREDGCTALLAGDGGDELFGGNARYAKQRIFGVYGNLPALLREGLLEPVFADGTAFDRIPLLKKVASYVRQARVPMPERLDSYNLLMRMGVEQVFGDALLGQIDTEAPTHHQRAVYQASPANASLVNKMLAFDWRYTLAENDLPKVIGSARLAGIEAAFPLLDDRLLDFSLALPTRYKLKGLKLRWFFKEALRGFLPDAILAKKKHGFGLPFGAWAVSHPALNALAVDSLHGLAERGIVRREFIARLLNEHLPAHPGFYGEMVWIMTMLEQWLRTRQETVAGLSQ